MAEKFTRYDPAEHLKTDEDIALYLDACLEDDPGDGSVVRAALGDIARARGMAQLARDTGVSREGLYRALSPDGNPEFATIMKVMKALGVSLRTSPVIAEASITGSDTAVAAVKRAIDMANQDYESVASAAAKVAVAAEPPTVKVVRRKGSPRKAA